nr:GTP-binding protein [Streptomyces sp. e14]
MGTLGLSARNGPSTPRRLHAALEDIACAAVRSRGRFLAGRPARHAAVVGRRGRRAVRGADRPLAGRAARRRLGDGARRTPGRRRRPVAPPKHGDRCQCLAFTSPGLDRDGLSALLDSCLLTDAEYVTGSDGWKRLPSAFDGLLDPVT